MAKKMIAYYCSEVCQTTNYRYSCTFKVTFSGKRLRDDSQG